jgi:hypothetical protein
MYLNKTYSEDLIDKYVSIAFDVHNSLKQNVLSPLHLNFVLEYAVKSQYYRPAGQIFNSMI